MLGVAEGLSAVSNLAIVAHDLLHKDQNDKIKECKQRALADVERFKQALLRGDIGTVTLMLDGLQTGISANITPDEADNLRRVKFATSAYDWLGYYCRARESSFLIEAILVREMSDKPSV